MDKGIMVKLDLNSTGFNNGVKSAVASTDKLNSALNNTNGALQRHGNIAGKIGSGLKATASAVASAMAVAGAATVALVSTAVKSFADYEQLVGGVQTLFKDSAAAVEANAQNAYKTAGLSANAYMETVTSFSASLLQSLGGDTEKAASYADSAIVDMADNANKMGSSMESIQNAYQGFAKQNYTMLDNLKLGYGGTKEEMQRLLDDAEKLSGIKYDISSFADITQAIHVIQTELDITNTTANEASSTISGSFNAMKAAWSNTLTSLITGGDNFDNSINALKDTVVTFAGNIMPAIESALSGIGNLISELAPVVAAELPKFLAKILPGLVTGAVQMVKSLGVAIVENAPLLMEALLEAFSTALGGVAPNLAPAMGEIGKALSGAMNSIRDAVAPLLPKLGQIFTKIVALVADILPPIINTVSAVITALSPVLEIIIDIVSDLITYLSPVISVVVQGVGEIITALAPLITLIAQALQPALKVTLSVIQAVMTVLKPIVEGALRHAALVIQTIVQLLTGDFAGAWESIKEIVTNAVSSIGSIFSVLVSAIGTHIRNCANIVGEVLSGIWQRVIDVLAGIGNSITSAITGVITWVVTSITATMQNIWNAITSTVSNVISAFQSIPSVVSGVFSSVWNTVTGVFDRIREKVSNVFTNVVNTIKNAVNKIKNAFNFSWSLPKIKLPHFSITGNFSLNPPSIPHFSVDWYKQGGIMTQPTMFGLNGDHAMVGGEAGPEAILPLTAFWDRLDRFFADFKQSGNPQPVFAGGRSMENHINVTVYRGSSDNDDTLANKVARVIVEKLENM